MAIIFVNERSKPAKAFLKFIKELSFISFLDESEMPNLKTKRAIQDAEDGKTTQCIDFDEYLKKVK